MVVPIAEFVDRYTMVDLLSILDFGFDPKMFSLKLKRYHPYLGTMTNKFWPTVRRIDEAGGDRNLVCSCASTDEYI